MQYLSTDPNAGKQSVPAKADGGYLSTDPQAGERGEPTFRVEVKASEGVEPSDGGLGAALADLGIGGLKGLGEVPLFIVRAIHAIPGVSKAIDDHYGIPGLSKAALGEADRTLEPANTTQAVGKFVEQAAETILPGRAITKAGTALAAKVAPTLSGIVGRTAANVVPRAAVEAVAGGGIAAVQGGDAGTAASLSAAIPAVGMVARRGAALAAPGSKLNALEDGAVEFARARDIPLDAATATGRPIVQRWQKMAGDNLGGSGIAETFRDAQGEALERVGHELADASNAGGRALTPVAAGERVRESLTTVRDAFGKRADEAYDALRALEAGATPTSVTSTVEGRVAGGGSIPVKQASEIRLAVDIGKRKDALRPLYEQLLQERKLTGQLLGAKGRALVALDTLLNGADFAPLSVVDGALSDLKALARVKDGALRSRGQGAFAFMVNKLDAAVREAAQRGGPKVTQALEAGRKATVQMHSVNEVIESLGDGAHGLFAKLTRQKDSGIELLRDVATHAPDELPNIGRAVLEDLMSKATAEGSFGHADKLWGEWKKLGPETRKLLFPKLASDLDRFFLVAKMMARNPNPSGTATQLTSRLTVAQVLGSVPNWAVAKLMYTPAGVRLMTKAAFKGEPSELAAALGRIVATQGSKVGGGQ